MECKAQKGTADARLICAPSDMPVASRRGYALTALLTIALAIGLGVTPICAQNPVVATSTFTVMGTTLQINASATLYMRPTNVTKVEIFYGVPFAQPPIGSLRLEKPQPVAPNVNVLNLTTGLTQTMCYIGIPFNIATYYSTQQGFGVNFNVSEDCLKMTIYRPQGVNANTSPKLPVFFNIFQGGFFNGAVIWDTPAWTNYNGPTMAYPNFYVSQGIIAVQPSYRLGMLGFGSDGTSDFPGNYGLWDQLMALQWVYNNIGYFGGDNQRITVFGLSSGAAATSLLTIQPQAFPYFKQNIHLSGSFNMPWVTPSKNSVNATARLASRVNCTQPPGAGLKTCLKSVAIDPLILAYDLPGRVQQDFAWLNYQPTYDNDWFTSNDFGALVAAAPPKPTIHTFSTDEGVTITPIFAAGVLNYTLTYANAANMSASDVLTLIQHYVQPSDASIPQALEQIDAVRQALFNFYMHADNQANATDPLFSFIQASRFLTDVIFNIGALWEARIKSQFGWPHYLLHFDHVDVNLFPTLPYYAVAHATEDQYFYGHPYGTYTWTRDAAAYNLTQIYVDFIVSFVKTGVPTSIFPQLNYVGSYQCSPANYTAMVLNYTAITEGPSSEMGLRLAFWDALSKQYDLRLVHHFPNTMQQCVPLPPCANRTSLIAAQSSSSSAITNAINATYTAWPMPNRIQFTPTFTAIKTAVFSPGSTYPTPASQVDKVVDTLNAWLGYVPLNRTYMMATRLGSWGTVQQFIDCGHM